jgi:hypothetical protein
MGTNKSLDKIYYLIAALLHDAHASLGDVFNTRSYRNTLRRVQRRYALEGPGFICKSLPRLGKHFDQVLAGQQTMDPSSCGFSAIRGSKLPRFLGELFQRVLSKDGCVLPDPDATSVKYIRQILFVFYKYELSYTEEQEHEVIQAFRATENDLTNLAPRFAAMRRELQEEYSCRRPQTKDKSSCAYLPPGAKPVKVLREARILLYRLFRSFDPSDIRPRHGPGVVATRQRLWEKYEFSNVSDRITAVYPLDEYFYASAGHVVDSYREMFAITSRDLPARVILVPKDSRGPRLISCEPVDFQWVQQGLMRTLVQHIEKHALTRDSVFFTDQVPNRIAALYGSQTRRYATLDLKEASDRVSLDLVRLLFPEPLLSALEACRSLQTELPSGEVITLNKYAPMGSALCFPVMALTIWALLSAAAPDAYSRERIHVYGDDVVVPTAYAESAMTILEAFGLKINRAKSCYQGSFRESCGMDAFNGVDVTPVRIRTVWDESPRPDTYESWISYANSMYHRGFLTAHEFIVSCLHSVYGDIPGEDMHLACPSLCGVTARPGAFKRRMNRDLQKLQYRVPVCYTPIVEHTLPGWLCLLRFFAEGCSQTEVPTSWSTRDPSEYSEDSPFSVSQYTKRRASILALRWR